MRDIMTQMQQMPQQKLSWGQVVLQVERTGIDDQLQLQLKQRQLKKKYLQTLAEQITRHQQDHRNLTALKIRERHTIEQQVKQQRQKRSLEKQSCLKKELQLKQQNYELIQLSHASKLKQPALPENPFVSLCDAEQRRKQLSREQLKQQNSINQMQHQIKQQAREENAKLDHLFTEKYIDHVEKYYEKKQQDRNLFKRKYLKINALQRSHLLQNSQEGSPIERDYSKVNISQIGEKNKRAAHREQLDDVLSKINRNLNLPSSSPAFLGRNPINYDRAKQLQYIDHSINALHQRTRTEGHQTQVMNQSQFMSHKKNAALAGDLPDLAKYYTNANKNEQNSRQKYELSPFQKAKNQSKTLFSEFNTEAMKSQKVTVQKGLFDKERKRFLSFDIILGKNKQVFL